MKFGEFIKKYAVPEWRDCYINYRILKLLTGIFETASETSKKKLTPEQINEVNQIALEANKKFFILHREELEVTFVFLQLKIIQMEKKFYNYKKLSAKGNEKILFSLETLYIEVSYLESLYDINIKGERKILKKHKKRAKALDFPSPNSDSHKLTRLQPQIKNLENQIEDIYIQTSTLPQKQARQKLRDLINKQQQDTVASFLFGTGFGIGISLIVIIITALSLKGINLQTDAYFKRDFPVWRGIGYFIIYLWVLGFNCYAFQKKFINHKLIFKFNDFHYSTSTQIFERASLFSAVFLILMLFYVLQRVIDSFSEINSFAPYLALIVWLMLALYLFLPAPIFNVKGRIYMFKLMFSAIISPFHHVQFALVWMTDQFVSLITPLKDFAYTICYYTQLDLNADPTAKGYVNKCSSSSNFEVVFLVGLIIYLYRMLQCIKLGIDTNSYFFKPNFFNTLKYFTSLMTLIFSFAYSSQNPIVFYFWIIFAVISTIYSYCWDLKMDWDLLQKDSKNKYLRDILIYENKYYYYAIIGVNLLLRLSWIFTLSPNIIASFNISSVIFTLITGTLQIIRRGIWNLLRVQKEHINNCKSLKAIQNVSEPLVEPVTFHSNVRITAQDEYRLIMDDRLDKLESSLKKRIEIKKKLLDEAQDFSKKQKKILEQIEKQMKEQQIKANNMISQAQQS